MNFYILTLFPELVDNILSESVIGRAREKGIINIEAINIRDFSHDKHKRVDDTPYGGGKGMLMRCEPVVECWESVKNKITGSSKTIIMSPQGQIFSQKKAECYREIDNIIIICGHYEGLDRRIVEICADEEVSIGDYILTGGEMPACIIVDAISRLVPGVLSDEECHEKESISCGMLEYPQYTRPKDFRGLSVPEVLQNGNHKEIDKWRYESALELTKKNRPDLLK